MGSLPIFFTVKTHLICFVVISNHNLAFLRVFYASTQNGIIRKYPYGSVLLGGVYVARLILKVDLTENLSKLHL